MTRDRPPRRAAFTRFTMASSNVWNIFPHSRFPLKPASSHAATTEYRPHHYMLPVINHLPLRPAQSSQSPAESFPDEASGCANLAAWHRPISPPCGGLAVISYVLIGALFTLGLLLFIH